MPEVQIVARWDEGSGAMSIDVAGVGYSPEDLSQIALSLLSAAHHSGWAPSGRTPDAFVRAIAKALAEKLGADQTITTRHLPPPG